MRSPAITRSNAAFASASAAVWFGSPPLKFGRPGPSHMSTGVTPGPITLMR
jgi:hypothetical protein